VNLVREQIGTAIGASAARLYIRNREKSNSYHEITVQQKEQKRFPPLSISRKTKDFLRKQPNGFMIHSAPEFVHHSLRYQPGDRDGLVVPLIIKDNLLGLLFFSLPEDQSTFDPKQQHFAVLLASQGALALENALLYEDQREKERLQRELEIAREVQQKLLPAQMPVIKGFQIDGFCRSAQEVGGDYFDFFDLGDSRWGIVIADVSGKGTSASFYMAELKGMMLQLTGRQPSPAELLIEINHYLHQNVDRHLFVTMIYGVLDVSNKRFTFARAGHNSLLHLDSKKNYRFLTPVGIGLGLESGKLFRKKIEEVALPITTGDTLVFFTDGVVEAMNRFYQEFGEERMVKVFLTHAHQNIYIQRKELLNSLEKFMDGQPQYDDITMILIKAER
jgi:sigma-B regulation protein RsbU (phosphoserine phosphatase)